MMFEISESLLDFTLYGVDSILDALHLIFDFSVDRVNLVVKTLEHIFNEDHLFLEEALHHIGTYLPTFEHYFEVLLIHKIVEKAALLLSAKVKDVLELLAFVEHILDVGSDFDHHLTALPCLFRT